MSRSAGRGSGLVERDQWGAKLRCNENINFTFDDQASSCLPRGASLVQHQTVRSYREALCPLVKGGVQFVQTGQGSSDLAARAHECDAVMEDVCFLLGEVKGEGPRVSEPASNLHGLHRGT
ncbi:unnamed protein product [Lota lota]